MCLGSSLEDFNPISWRIGREYNARLVKDIEVGLKDWENLSKSIDPTCWTLAKECVSPPDHESVLSEPESFLSEPESVFSEPEPVESEWSDDQKMCTSWNVFRKNGCQYEFLYPGAVCKFKHQCSICLNPHKALHCPEN